MRRFRFTQRALEDLPVTGRRELIFDEQIPCLAILLTPTGAKSFYVVKKYQGRKLMVHIGSLREVPIPAARKLASDFLLQMATGEYVPERQKEKPRDVLTLSVCYNEYYRYLSAHRKASSISQYERLWKKHLEPWGGDRGLEEIRRREVVDLHREVGELNGHHLANRVVAFLRAIINRAIREEELDMPNPANAITFFREGRRSRRLQQEELPAFFKAVEEEPNRDIRDFVLVALFTGARKSNVLSMRWQDVSLDRGLWVVPAGDSKNGKELDVVLSGHVVELLRARRAEVSGLYVFPGREGRSNPHMKDPKIGWERICKRAGLTDLHMHDLRRSLASFQIDTGSPLEVIQKTLGHESKVTTEIYARLALEPVRESVERAAEEMLKHSTRSNRTKTE